MSLRPTLVAAGLLAAIVGSTGPLRGTWARTHAISSDNTRSTAVATTTIPVLLTATPRVVLEPDRPATLKITGTDFEPGLSVTLSSPQEVLTFSADALQELTPTSVHIDVTSVTEGSYVVSIRNPSGRRSNAVPVAVVRRTGSPPQRDPQVTGSASRYPYSAMRFHITGAGAAGLAIALRRARGPILAPGASTMDPQLHTDVQEPPQPPHRIRAFRELVTAPDTRVCIDSYWDIIEARRQARRMAMAAGLRATELAIVVAVISELAGNTLLFADGGDILVSLIRHGARQGVAVIATDSGPGIADIPRALQDGHSTAGRLGLGLPGVKRLMDEFEISSTPGKGTTVIARKWKR